MSLSYFLKDLSFTPQLTVRMCQCLSGCGGAAVEGLSEYVDHSLLLGLLLLRWIGHLTGILTAIGALAQQRLTILPYRVHEELHLFEVAPARFLAQFHFARELVAQALPSLCTFLL